MNLNIDAQIYVEAANSSAAITDVENMSLEQMRDATVPRRFPKKLNSVNMAQMSSIDLGNVSQW